MNNYLPYDPGTLPTRASPNKGEKLVLIIEGLPPAKRPGVSLRNPKHPRYQAFVDLRKAAAKAMRGRAWYFGPIGLDLVVYNNENKDRWALNEFLGGIMDTLDGSSGVNFTYLPIVYEDDCQVSEAKFEYVESKNSRYSLTVRFL